MKKKYTKYDINKLNKQVIELKKKISNILKETLLEFCYYDVTEISVSTRDDYNDEGYPHYHIEINQINLNYTYKEMSFKNFKNNKNIDLSDLSDLIYHKVLSLKLYPEIQFSAKVNRQELDEFKSLLENEKILSTIKINEEIQHHVKKV